MTKKCIKASIPTLEPHQ